ncbi:MAG: MFS transporter [bacterium]|nr:MFS transporter [bacterium]
MFRAIFNSYREAFGGLPRPLWLLSGVTLVNRAGTMVVPFISLYLAQDRGISTTVVGRILALYGIGAMIGAYLGGWLSDRIGALRTQKLSLVGSGFAFLVLGMQESMLGISIAAFVASVISEAYRPAAMSSMAQIAPRELQARAFALLRLAVNVGQALGPAAAGFLALRSYMWLFVGDAATCWLAALIVVVGFRGSDAHGASPAAERAEVRRSPWRDVPFVLLMLIVVSLAAAFFQIFSTVPLYFSEGYGFREDVIGTLFALNALLIVLFEMVLIHRTEKYDRLSLIGLGSFLTCAGLALMPLGSGVLFVALTVTVWTFGEMLTMPLMSAAVAERAPANSRGRYMGFFTMSFALAFVFAPALGTWVYATISPAALWYGIGVLGVLLWVASLALRGPYRAIRRDSRPPA